MIKSFIAWIPFLVLLGILGFFRVYNIANRFYPIFLLLMICFGLALVLIYKFVIKQDPIMDLDKKA